MKKLIYFSIILSVLFACEDLPEFDDYDYNAVYFPHQFPVRTISLGHDFFDNAGDREGKFKIGAAIGGMYENKRDWAVDFVIDHSLVENLVTEQGDTIYTMPSNYYTLSNANTITIPKGSLSGTIEVQLTDAFFEDSLAVGNHYVIPLRITGSDADSVLQGAPIASDPDRVVLSDWETDMSPKDFTLFCVKYINDMDGEFLFKGFDVLTYEGYDLDTVVTSGVTIRDLPLWTLNTSALSSVVTNSVSFNTSDVGDYQMELNLNADNTITIDSVASSLIKPFQDDSHAESKFLQDAEEWGGKPRDAMYLNYSYWEGLVRHNVTDTLIFRNRDVVFEVFAPVRYTP